MGYPKKALVYVMEHPINMDDNQGYPHSRKPPYHCMTKLGKRGGGPPLDLPSFAPPPAFVRSPSFPRVRR